VEVIVWVLRLGAIERLTFSAKTPHFPTVANSPSVAAVYDRRIMNNQVPTKYREAAEKE